MSVNGNLTVSRTPHPAVVLELLKPITWFPPMWAFMCGVVSSGQPLAENWPLIVVGILLAGPVVCGMSQAANDWCDRHVDAINEPGRPIPSGRMPGRWGLWIALAMSGLALLLGATLGPWGFDGGRGRLRLGLFRGTRAAEALRLVGAGGGGPLL
jgi:chlorophyll synthase